jgi:hypothetical protein
MSLTLVTVLFDLTRRSPTPRRSMEWLIENGKHVLALPYPMVIFTERDLVNQLDKVRRPDSERPTHYEVLEFEDLPHYHEWRNLRPQPELIDNRDPERDRLDNFSINWEKPGLIAQVARECPLYFNTTHVAWINLGIQNVKAFDPVGWQDAFDPPDKVRIHQQRYLNAAMVDDPDWYRFGRCVTAGGYISGSVAAIQEFATLFYAEFDRALGLGRWPGDEDVIGRLLVHQPDKFAVSYGDYGQMLCNAKRPRWGGGAWTWAYNRSLYWMIDQALQHGDEAWAANLWRTIMRAKRDGFFLDDTALIEPLAERFGELV